MGSEIYFTGKKLKGLTERGVKEITTSVVERFCFPYTNCLLTFPIVWGKFKYRFETSKGPLSFPSRSTDSFKAIFPQMFTGVL